MNSTELLQRLEEKKRRNEIRRSMDLWSRHCGFVPAAHHRILNNALETAAREGGKHIAIFLPPGSAKSTYGSVLFPPHFLANGESRCILTASHSDSLAESFGRRARNLVDQNGLVLGYTLRRDSKAAGEWETSNGGRYFCAGVGTKIAGHRADLVIIDDPVGKREDADSKLMRDKVWDWWIYDVVPRIKPNGSVVLIQTRWHEDDLGGRLLNPAFNADASAWQVISIPLIADSVDDVLGRTIGSPLWPEYFTSTMIETAKRSPAFVPLYQQKPTPESGDYFKVEWLRTYDSVNNLPSNLRYYVGSDHAISTKNSADKTCIIPVGVDSRDEIWVLPDVWWKREESAEAVDEMFRIASIYHPCFWWAGKEHITGSIRPFMERLEMERHIFIPFEELTSGKKDLSARAYSIRGMMKFGRVHFPSFATWWPDAKNEMLRFDKGTHDDFVAALAELGRGLSKMVGHRSPAIEVSINSALPPPPITIGWVKNEHKRIEDRRKAELIDV